MKLQGLVEIKITLSPVSRVASCMHKFLWKLLSFVTVSEDFRRKYRERWNSRKSEAGIFLQCLFEQNQHDCLQENNLREGCVRSFSHRHTGRLEVRLNHAIKGV